ncbi:hypothetical protein L3Q82_015367 [Scortum barcoo]|uniref:Uncharacterized protein n=1 Tax=Scortum barcoo TaxID=214431 RepID=A0ACB8VVQ5_9TELE|nr:hypothetical protein L3Q82_015367 [Scortum barcoo]
MPDPAFQLDGRLLFRADRNQQFTAVFVTAVYIPPGAKANEALKELHNNISSLQHKHPEAFYVVAGDFNHVNLTDTLPKFYQHVTIPTRGNNTLDRVYTNKRDAYRAVPHPHLGFSDHISIMLLPACRPLLRRHTPTQRTITVWPSDAVPALQDCFSAQTGRFSGRQLSVRERWTWRSIHRLSSATSASAQRTSTSTRTVTEYPNQKPWLNAEVRSLLKARDAAFRSGDRLALRAARRQLTAGVKRAKAAYAQRIQGHFTSNDPRSMWRGIKCITDYNTRDAQCPRDPSLPDALNNFYARFDDTSPSTRFTPPPGEGAPQGDRSRGEEDPPED